VRPLFVLLVLLFDSALYSQAPSHGTINILLANGKGMVLITDSRASDQFGRKINDQSQKLFQIDSVTVCSIAGFGSDPGPNGKLLETASGRIFSIAGGLEISGGKLSFEDKISLFTKVFSARLVAVETEYEYAKNSGTPRPPQGLQMLFAGFDANGSASIAKVIISIKSSGTIDSHRQFRSDVDIKIKPVRKDFVFLTAGVDQWAQDRLQRPTAFANETELKEYSQAFRRGRTAELNLDQLERLARYLELDTSRSTSVVGGPIQTATLSDHHIHVTQPENLIVYPKPYATSFVFDSGIENSRFAPMVFPTPHSIFVNNYCRNAAVILDDQTFIGGDYLNCYFYFDGGDFYRDPTVEVHGGKLVLGPHVQMDSYFLEKARRSMPELTPIPYTDLPNPEAVRKGFWPND
jgi:hypothetical protein